MLQYKGAPDFEKAPGSGGGKVLSVIRFSFLLHVGCLQPRLTQRDREGESDRARRREGSYCGLTKSCTTLMMCIIPWELQCIGIKWCRKKLPRPMEDALLLPRARPTLNLP